MADLTDLQTAQGNEQDAWGDICRYCGNPLGPNRVRFDDPRYDDVHFCDENCVQLQAEHDKREDGAINSSCTACGKAAGGVLTPGCNHLLGCGFWRLLLD